MFRAEGVNRGVIPSNMVANKNDTPVDNTRDLLGKLTRQTPMKRDWLQCSTGVVPVKVVSGLFCHECSTLTQLTTQLPTLVTMRNHQHSEERKCIRALPGGSAIFLHFGNSPHSILAL